MASYLHRLTGTKRAWLPEPDPDDVELSTKRRRNDERHESRWGSIIDRYSRNFDDVGDEIDLRTGEIIVNRGHLSGMRNEFDNGDGLSSTAPQYSDILGHMVDESGSESEEEEDEDAEDELSSNWPVSSPRAERRRSRSAPRRLSPSVEITSKSPSTEEQYQDAEESIEEQDIAVPSAEDTEDVPIQQQGPELPQFQMPQMGFGGQLEGAMAAMSTAMGAAIQAQMMAFMNVVLAAQQGNGAVPAAGLALPPAPMSNAATNMPPPQHRPVPRSEPAPRAANNSSNTAPSKKHNGLSEKDKAIRQQTPGLGSIWAPHGKRGRKKGSKNAPKAAPAEITTTAAPGPSRLTSLDISPGAQSDEEVDEEDELPQMPEWEEDADDDETLSEEQVSRAGPSIPATTKSTDRPAPRNPAEHNGLASRGKAPTPNVDHRDTAPQRSSGLGQSPHRYILDSDEDEDELDILTPDTSLRELILNSASKSKQSSVTPRVEIITPSRKTETAVKPQAQKKSVVNLESDEELDTEYSENPNTSLRQPQSRPGLRNRKDAINYNIKATFNGLLGNEDREPLRKTHGEYLHIASAHNSIGSLGDHATQLVDYEAPFSLQFAANDSEASSVSQARIPKKGRPRKSEAPQKPFVESEYVYKPRPTIHKYRLDAPFTTKKAASEATAKQQNVPTANMSLPRTQRKTYDKRTAFEVYNSLTEEDMLAREAEIKFVRKKDIHYDERPPPLPCSNCKATAATAWAGEQDERHRKECNACAGFRRRHNGQKRPASLEEFRSMKNKQACENCGKMSVSEWSNVVESKVLCTPCGRYAKRNSGAMRPYQRLPLSECERCGESVTQIFTLSNRAQVCIGCHNEVFADYDPTTDDGTAEHDSGELFFDRCLLVFAINFLPTTPIKNRNRKGDYTANALGVPCKVCQTYIASYWRPALDNAPLCSLCYYKTIDMIHDHGLKQLAEQKVWEVQGIRTDGFACACCEEEIVGSLWRGDVVHGRVLCSGCHRKKVESGEIRRTREESAEVDAAVGEVGSAEKEARREETVEEEDEPADDASTMAPTRESTAAIETDADFVEDSRRKNSRTSSKHSSAKRAAQISTMDFDF